MDDRSARMTMAPMKGGGQSRIAVVILFLLWNTETKTSFMKLFIDRERWNLETSRWFARRNTDGVAHMGS